MAVGIMSRWQIVAFSLAAIGCGREPDPRYLQYLGRDTIPVLSLIESERLRGESFGGFSGIRAVVPLSEERIAVADINDRVIRILDGDGTEIMKLGRRGHGPGEFEILSGLWGSSGDTLVAYDSRLRRIQIGHYRTGFTDAWSSTVVDDSSSLVHPVGVLQGGVIVLESLHTLGPANPPRVERRPQRLNLFHAGAPIRVISGFRGTEAYEGSRYVIGLVVLVPHMLYATTGDEIFSLNTADDMIAVHGADGEFRRKIAIPIKPRPVTEADIRADRERRMNGARQYIGSGLPHEFVQGQLDKVSVIPSADTIPSAADLWVDEMGRLWIRLFAPEDEEASQGQRWIVLQGDGAPLGQFRLPSTLSVARPSNGSIWTWGQDSIGIPYIQKWRVEGLVDSRRSR